jgi:GNAT superfamily N-acetyltransferase
MRFQLRKAEAADLEFIWQLRVATMKEAICNSYGWDEATQREYAEESLRGQIVQVDNQPVGVLTLADWGDQLHLVWMALLPTWQGQGLGSELMACCQDRALKLGKPLTLQVLRNNPAVTFYEKFGFKLQTTNGPHKLLMRWSDNAG